MSTARAADLLRVFERLGASEPAAEQLASLPSALDKADGWALPAVLSPGDRALYRKIFALQDAGRWEAADRAIARLGDRVLMGHLLAQRYLHPTKYRSEYDELRTWLAAYSDHPQAKRIYKLALRRKPKGAEALRRPKAAESLYAASGVVAEEPPEVPRKAMSRSQRRKAYSFKRQVARALRKGWTKAAKEVLESKVARATLDPIDYDALLADLAVAYLRDNRVDWALRWAEKGAGRSGRYVPETHWAAGLAAWRLERMDTAAAHFEAAASSPHAAPAVAAAAAFWAARANLVARHPERVNRWLLAAADHPGEFYGLLALRALGQAMPFDWTLPPLDPKDLARLSGQRGAVRSLALLEVGRAAEAQDELRRLFDADQPRTIATILAIAARADMPWLSWILARHAGPVTGLPLDACAYPLTDMVPEEGLLVDRALILALMRQESGFNPNAKSHAGARGLMQLMPRTASFVTGDRGFRGRKRGNLFDPETNVAVGQKFARHLLEDVPTIQGNLIKFLVGWNAGAGTLRRWMRTIRHDDDPLLFVELIPVRETRVFAKRVLAYYWIYRHRLGQPTPSLDAAAAGDWPLYVQQDAVEVAEQSAGTDDDAR